MNLTKLSAEFPKDAVHWRIQGKPYERQGQFSGMALAYIDARDVMDRLDEVCGPDRWQNQYDETPSGRIVCQIGILAGDNWVWKSDGAGNTAVEGEKGGISDALKRAAVNWGIGRYLYRLDSPWVKCSVNQKNGKTYWKKWDEDPWSKVKSVGYTQTPPEQSTATRGEMRDRLKAAIMGQSTEDGLNKLWSQATFQAEFDKLPEPMQGELKKAKSDKGDELAGENQ